MFIGRKPVYLVKPTTFMNLSGDAVRNFIDYHKLEDFSKILVVLDDINLSFGTVRLRAEAGGQKGLKSIIDKLNTTKIPRLRVGIGSNFYNATSHVLTPFSITEKRELPQIINWAADAAESFVKYGIEKTMNRFNRNIFSVNNKEELS
ncbi:MAG: aminoacyl-tRNA hydrolase [Calditrichia bacterium]